MSLAFALMAAINSSTGSRGTLSHGLYYRTNPSRPQSGGREHSHPSWVAAQGAALDAVAQTTAVVAEAQRFGSGCGMRERTMCLESEIPDLRAKVRVGAAASARTIVAMPQAISGASPLCNSVPDGSCAVTGEE